MERERDQILREVSCISYMYTVLHIYIHVYIHIYRYMSYMYTTITHNQILGREVLESGGKPLQGKKFTVGEVFEEVGNRDDAESS